MKNGLTLTEGGVRATISHFLLRGKSLLKHLENKDIFTILTIILVAFASFGLGRLSKIEERASPIRVENTARVLEGGKGNLAETSALSKSVPIEVGTYVASKTGKKYHLPWCSGAQRIKEETKVWFDSKRIRRASRLYSRPLTARDSEKLFSAKLFFLCLLERND